MSTNSQIPSILDNFGSLRRAIAALRANETKDLEFGHIQISVLYKLSLAKATMSELVEYTVSDKATLTRSVSTLVEMGFVRRVPSETDRRVTYIELTAKGKVQAEKAHQIRNSMSKKLQSCLNNEEKILFQTLVGKLIQNLEKYQTEK